MRHKHHVTSVVVVVVESFEINLAKHSSGFGKAFTFSVDVEIIAEGVHQCFSILNRTAFRDSGIELCRDCLPAFLVEYLDDCGWL